MDGKRVRELEHEIEAAIAKVMQRSHKPPPSERVFHLMAKAAAAVFEAAADPETRNHESYE